MPANFPRLLGEIKARIQQAQTRAVLSVNAELVRLYWDIGRLIGDRQQTEGWGAGVIPRLARELATQPSVPLLWAIPWFHHVILMEKVKEPATRVWYMAETLANGWSRNVLLAMIQSAAHRRKGNAITNFDRLLPAPQSDLVRQTLKDPYIFDFLTLQEPFHERELEVSLLHQLERFLIELGQGFAFVGRQFRIEVGDKDFSIDLLFYHLRLRCYIVIDLKKGEFKPEYAGKMNFYLGVVEAQLRKPKSTPSKSVRRSAKRRPSGARKK